MSPTPQPAEKVTTLDLLARGVKLVFNRRVRAALYGAGIAADGALVAAGELPAWTLAVAGPLLLALLNLSPADVPADPAPGQD